MKLFYTAWNGVRGKMTDVNRLKKLYELIESDFDINLFKNADDEDCLELSCPTRIDIVDVRNDYIDEICSIFVTDEWEISYHKDDETLFIKFYDIKKTSVSR